MCTNTCTDLLRIFLNWTLPHSPTMDFLVLGGPCVRCLTFLIIINVAINKVSVHLPTVQPCYLEFPSMGWPQQRFPVLPVPTFSPHSVKPQSHHGRNAFNSFSELQYHEISSPQISYWLWLSSRYVRVLDRVFAIHVLYATHSSSQPHHHCYLFPGHLCRPVSKT